MPRVSWTNSVVSKQLRRNECQRKKQGHRDKKRHKCLLFRTSQDTCVLTRTVSIQSQICYHWKINRLSTSHRHTDTHIFLTWYHWLCKYQYWRIDETYFVETAEVVLLRLDICDIKRTLVRQWNLKWYNNLTYMGTGVVFVSQQLFPFFEINWSFHMQSFTINIIVPSPGMRRMVLSTSHYKCTIQSWLTVVHRQ